MSRDSDDILRRAGYVQLNEHEWVHPRTELIAPENSSRTKSYGTRPEFSRTPWILLVLLLLIYGFAMIAVARFMGVI